ncbi:Fidgetin-like protein 1 [Toxocara canis]|uniref:Fidgetin-like protein 1 n=1 Tax=Toxocara canis TaxID=6265 RepID=A0A0B2VTN8_TOXCA|nr:Fidgetin-like protein 1 [Toxocara canis]
MSAEVKKGGEVKRQQTTLKSFVKRKCAGEDDVESCASAASCDQMVPSEKKSRSALQRNKVKFQFNFAKDPLLMEMQKKIAHCGKKLDEAEADFVSEKEAGESLHNIHFKKSARMKRSGDSVPHHFASRSDFRTASGRPVDKEVHAVTASEVDASSSKYRERDRFLGNRPFRAPLPVHKEAEADCLLQQRLPDVNGKAGKGRSGWKADESLRHFDDNIIDLIESEIMWKREATTWEDIAGLEAAKKALREIVILPFLRPDIFTGIRAPPKGVLLFGPPGTGKTMIGRCVAAQCKATFFNIAASSLTSKWVGEGEKLVRVLFAVARVLQPSIIFIDEIDSLLTSRSEGEHESSRRIKTEFLIHLDGVATFVDERLLVLGATNRPHELDDAAKRRFVKRLYISLPCADARTHIVRSLLCTQKHDLRDEDFKVIADITEGYSGADMKELCAEASMGPIRDIIESSSMDIATIDKDQVRAVTLRDFENAARVVRPTVVEKDLLAYREWDSKFGSLNST